MDSVPIPDVAISRIQHTFSTARLDAQSDYIHKHAGEYSQSDLDRILSAIEKQRLVLNPEPTDYNCALISEIEVVYSEEGNAFRISPRSHTHNLQKYCELARMAGKRLSEYIIDSLGDVSYYDLRYAFNAPTAAIKGLYEPDENENEVEIGGQEPEPEEPHKANENEVRVNLDLLDIIHRLEQRIEELGERIEAGASRQDIDTLRKQIADLERQRDEYEKRYNNIVNAYEREKTTKVYETTLTAKEYGIFQEEYAENLPGLKPYTFHKAGEGYNIRIEYQTKEEEDAIEKFILRVHTIGRPSQRGTNPAANTKMADMLCRNFERETGSKCGVSRYGAIAALVDMISDYIKQINERMTGRHEFDASQLEGLVYEMDMFAHPGQKVYTLEQAQEAFGAFVRNVENRVTDEGISGGGREVDMCEPSVMYPNFIDVYVYLNKLAEHKPITEDNKKNYDRALSELEKCGYTPAKYKQFLDGAIGFFEEMNQDFYAIVEEYMKG